MDNDMAEPIKEALFQDITLVRRDSLCSEGRLSPKNDPRNVERFAQGATCCKDGPNRSQESSCRKLCPDPTNSSYSEKKAQRRLFLENLLGGAIRSGRGVQMHIAVEATAAAAVRSAQLRALRNAGLT